MTKKKTAPDKDPVYTEESGAKTAADLFKEIVDYKFTETEAQRKADWDKEKSDINEKIAELENEGMKLLRGVSAGEKADGFFPNAKRVKEIETEQRELRMDLHRLTFLPIVDDEYITICGELEEITAQRKEKESCYAEAIEEYEASRGRVPFDLYRKTEEECYSLSEEVEDLKKKERALLDKKARYERKADVLLNEYQQAKTAEAKQYILDHVKDLREYAVAVHGEMAQAEAITLARKEVVPSDIALPVPFGGDTIRQVVHFFDEIIQVTEMYL